jgi:hypothetical protein
MGASESTVSRLKNEHLESFCLMLAFAGLKIVPAEMRCFSPDKVQALLTFSKAYMDTIHRPDQLVWGEEA